MLELGRERLPVRAHVIAEENENATPDRGADEGLQEEAGQGHACDSGGHRDDVTDHRQESADQDGFLTVLGEELLGLFDVVLPDEEVLAVALEEWFSSDDADPVTYAGSEERRGAVDDQDHRERELTT